MSDRYIFRFIDYSCPGKPFGCQDEAGPARKVQVAGRLEFSAAIPGAGDLGRVINESQPHQETQVVFVKTKATQFANLNGEFPWIGRRLPGVFGGFDQQCEGTLELCSNNLAFVTMVSWWKHISGTGAVAD